jgi:hypothetical protein
MSKSPSHRRHRALQQQLLDQQHEQRQAATMQQASTAAASAMAAGVAAATSGRRPASSQHQNLQPASGTSPNPATSSMQLQRQGSAPRVPAASASRPPMSGSTPVHTAVRYSYLSSDGVWLAKHDGLLNLSIIILIITNFRYSDSCCCINICQLLAGNQPPSVHTGQASGCGRHCTQIPLAYV